MVHELAEYEKAPERYHLTAAQLTDALFPADAPPALLGHLAVDEPGDRRHRDDEWVPYRFSGEALRQLAAATPPVEPHR